MFKVNNKDTRTTPEPPTKFSERGCLTGLQLLEGDYDMKLTVKALFPANSENYCMLQYRNGFTRLF